MITKQYINQMIQKIITGEKNTYKSIQKLTTREKITTKEKNTYLRNSELSQIILVFKS